MGYEQAIRSEHPGYKGRKAKDLTGYRSGRLVVSEYYGYEQNAHGPIHYWLCVCDCGGSAVVASSNLRRGNSQSCGCLKLRQLKARSTTHSMRKTPEYNSWSAMKGRCSNPNNRSFQHYGGRGITVCHRWKESFENFYADMGARPGPDYSLERVDVNGNYEPSNCRWATMAAQAKNKRANHIVEYGGEKMILADAILAAGLPPKAVSNRLSRGWSVERALDEPLHVKGGKAKKRVTRRSDGIYVMVDGETMLLKTACTKLGLNYKAVYYKVRKGEPPQKAISQE